jgi:N-acetylglucosaminyldiphosphoundecaprenol N-acetyl-beta-D-mannosaminyltransferase
LKRRRYTNDPAARTIFKRDEAVISAFGLPLTCTRSLAHAEELIRSQVVNGSERPFLVSFANPLGVKLVKSDPAYRVDIHRMNLVFCDGIALAVAIRQEARWPMARVSFDSTGMAPCVFRLAEEHKRTMALVGGRPGVAEAAAAKIRENFPHLRIVVAVDGYRRIDALIRTTVDAAPDIVVCGMGAPLQEAFLATLADSGWCGVGFTCGGYLDQLVDRFDFYPAVINRLNLRWLYRLAREPRRIGYRCAVEYAPFWRAAALEFMCRRANPIHIEAVGDHEQWPDDDTRVGNTHLRS